MKLHCTKDDRGVEPGIRTVYVYDELNVHGESLIVELRRGYVNARWVDGLRKKAFRLPDGAVHWLCCDVEYHDAEGNAWNGGKSDYNPTIKPADEYNGYTTEFDWVIEDVPENREMMLQEVERRFYGSAATERVERAS